MKIHLRPPISTGTGMQETMHEAAAGTKRPADGQGSDGGSSKRRFSLDLSDQTLEPVLCFGMISDNKCQLLEHLQPGSVDMSRSESPENEFIPLQLIWQSGQYLIELSDEQRVAVLNSQTARGLLQIRTLHSVYVKAYALRSDIASILEPPYKAKSRTFPVQINVFGRASEELALGNILSQRKLFLQDPFWMSEQLTYSNPHLLKFDDLSEADIWLAELDVASFVSGKTLSETNWNSVLDDLPQYHKSQPETDDTTIRTELMIHQIDGQDFMVKRETGRIEDGFKFWHLTRNEDGAAIYRHKVTQIERTECPPEPRGGILGDDMGLGKTLTTLFLITSSLDRASAFASDQRHQNGGRLGTTATKSTLVVAPSLMILDDWIKDIKKHIKPGTLRVTCYHGHERVRHYTEILDYDIVLTTYGTVTTEYRRMRSRQALYYLGWFRIVLDEAHTIRSQHTKQFEAIMALNAQHHWCLTGTPISNKVDDLGALVRFCRVPLLDEPRYFRENILRTARKSFTQACRVLRLTLAPLCLRRTRSILGIPPPNTTLCAVRFSTAELETYRGILLHCQRALNAVVSGRSVSTARHTLLQSILQLRRFCNHGTYTPAVADEVEEDLDPDEALTLLQESDEACCSCCFSDVQLVNQLEDPYSAVVGVCSHVLCNTCFKENAGDQTESGFFCPVCNCVVEKKCFQHGEHLATKTPKLNQNRSAKLERLLENLTSTKDSEKSLVFSVWKKTTDLIADMCIRRNIKHVCIDGTTPHPDRRRALAQFKDDKSTSILLMTLGTGALGLNLTAATRIHIVEPQWNPAVEEQAVARAVRFGQEKNTTVIRYLVKDSVEEHIQSYQKRKIQLAAASFGDGAESQAEAQIKLLTATFFRQPWRESRESPSEPLDVSSVERGN